MKLAKFFIAIGNDMSDVPLAVARLYKYLGISVGPELDAAEIEDSYRARAQGLLSLFGNLGGASCDQLVHASNQIRHGSLTFAARTMAFGKSTTEQLDTATLHLLATNGDRVRHSRRIGAFMPSEAGGAGVRFTRGSTVAAHVDEPLRACGGRAGEPARAQLLALMTALAARMGWQGPSRAAPTPFDFRFSPRWRGLLSSRIPSEALLACLLDFDLQLHGTGVAECAKDTRAARDEDNEARLEKDVALSEISDITLSMRLHGLGINSISDLHGGSGELLAPGRVEVIFARPGWPWRAADKAHVERQLEEIRNSSSAEVQAWLRRARSQELPIKAELSLLEKLNAARRAAIARESIAAGILWCRDDATEGRMYEVLLHGGRREDAVWLSMVELQAHVRRLGTAHAAAYGSIEEASALMARWADEAGDCRWIPATINDFLTRRLGAAGASLTRHLAAGKATAGKEATAARIELARMLLLEYAKIKTNCGGPVGQNLTENHSWQDSLKHKPSGQARIFNITCKGGKSADVEGDAGKADIDRVLLDPPPEDADGSAIDEDLACEQFGCVNFADDGPLWRGWRNAYETAGDFDRHPEAMASPLLRCFLRCEEMESPDGLLIANGLATDGARASGTKDPLHIRVSKEECSKITPQVTRALLRELGKLAVDRRARGRDEYRLVAATDGGFKRARTPTPAEALRAIEQGGEREHDVLPRAASAAYYGPQLRGSKCPVAEGEALPPGADNNVTELGAILLALRRHVALLEDISPDEVAARIAQGTEPSCDGLACPHEAGPEAKRTDNDVLLFVDSEIATSALWKAWSKGDLWLLRGESYGLMVEELVLLLRWIAWHGGVVDLIRLSSHVGFIPNVYVDAAATAAMELGWTRELQFARRRTLAVLSRRGGFQHAWHGSCAEYRSVLELDGRLSKKLRKHVDSSLLFEMIKTHAKVTAARQSEGGLQAETEALTLADGADELLTLLEIVKEDLRAHADGSRAAELIGGRLFATPIYDYALAGRDVTKGQQQFDRCIQKALSTQRGGGAGNEFQLTRIGLRDLFRNFDLPVLSGLFGLKDGEGQRVDFCPACGLHTCCDVLHFFSCACGASIKLRRAVCNILEEWSLLLPSPDGEDCAGCGDLHLELAWARAVVLCQRAGVGTYRRYQAARVFAGSPSPPATPSLRSRAEEWVANGFGAEPEDDVDDKDADREDAFWRSEYDVITDSEKRAQLKAASRQILREYTHKACALNTLIIDHVRKEFDGWLSAARNGWEQHRRRFGKSSGAEALLHDETIVSEHLKGRFEPADGSCSYDMSDNEFASLAADGALPQGSFVKAVAGECWRGSQREADGGRPPPKDRSAEYEAQRRRAQDASFGYAREEHERELGPVLERRIERGYRGLDACSEEEAAILGDGGLVRALKTMAEASDVGRMQWFDEATSAASDENLPTAASRGAPSTAEGDIEVETDGNEMIGDEEDRDGEWHESNETMNELSEHGVTENEVQVEETQHGMDKGTRGNEVQDDEMQHGMEADRQPITTSMIDAMLRQARQQAEAVAARENGAGATDSGERMATAHDGEDGLGLPGGDSGDAAMQAVEAAGGGSTAGDGGGLTGNGVGSCTMAAMQVDAGGSTGGGASDAGAGASAARRKFRRGKNKKSSGVRNYGQTLDGRREG